MFRKESFDAESVMLDESKLADDFSDEDDDDEHESGTHHRFNGISNENFVRLVWRLGYQLDTTTMRWGKEDTKKLDKYGNKVYDNTKGANIPVGSDH